MQDEMQFIPGYADDADDDNGGDDILYFGSSEYIMRSQSRSQTNGDVQSTPAPAALSEEYVAKIRAMRLVIVLSTVPPSRLEFSQGRAYVTAASILISS